MRIGSKVLLRWGRRGPLPSWEAPGANKGERSDRAWHRRRGDGGHGGFQLRAWVAFWRHGTGRPTSPRHRPSGVNRSPGSVGRPSEEGQGLTLCPAQPAVMPPAGSQEMATPTSVACRLSQLAAGWPPPGRLHVRET